MTMCFRLNHLLEQSAGTHPTHTCIIDGNRTTSYGDLEGRSSAMARWLISRGVGPGDRVGIFLPKCTESVVAIFGIMKAGAIYVPIDGGSPPPRAAHIVRDCGVRAVVTDPRRSQLLDEELADHGAAITRIVVGGDGEPSAGGWEDVVSWDGDEPLPAGTERDLAYILYTSGSTGLPKGVMISHRAALSFVDWGCSQFELTGADVVSSHAPLHFDLSVFDLFASVKAGATIVLFGDGASTFPVRLTQAIAEHRISVWYSVPTALALMIDRGRFTETDTSSLRVILFAGEVYPTPKLRLLKAATPARLYNLFGPTETNVCTFHEVVQLPRDDAETIPIGAPIPNYEILVLSQDDTPVAVGEEGELVARGPGLMSGYWGDPEKTGRTLVQNPLHERFHDPVYRTGDLVRFDETGALRFLGRRDHQVKVRGYRIELGEIEAALHTHTSVSEAACIVRPNPDGDPAIVGVVSFRAGAATSVEELRDHCVATVPRYMVPDAFETLASLPKTSTGKTDRRAILELLSRAD